MTEKKYINGVYIKEVKTNFGSLLNVSYTAEGIGLLQSFLQDKSYVNTTVMKRREADKYGNTHYMILNEYKPATDKTTAEKPGSVEPETDNNDLPF